MAMELLDEITSKLEQMQANHAADREQRDRARKAALEKQDQQLCKLKEALATISQLLDESEVVGDDVVDQDGNLVQIEAITELKVENETAKSSAEQVFAKMSEPQNCLDLEPCVEMVLDETLQPTRQLKQAEFEALEASFDPGGEPDVLWEAIVANEKSNIVAHQMLDEMPNSPNCHEHKLSDVIFVDIEAINQDELRPNGYTLMLNSMIGESVSEEQDNVTAFEEVWFDPGGEKILLGAGSFDLQCTREKSSDITNVVATDLLLIDGSVDGQMCEEVLKIDKFPNQGDTLVQMKIKEGSNATMENSDNYVPCFAPHIGHDHEVWADFSKVGRILNLGKVGPQAPTTMMIVTQDNLRVDRFDEHTEELMTLISIEEKSDLRDFELIDLKAAEFSCFTLNKNDEAAIFDPRIDEFMVGALNLSSINISQKNLDACFTVKPFDPGVFLVMKRSPIANVFDANVIASTIRCKGLYGKAFNEGKLDILAPTCLLRSCSPCLGDFPYEYYMFCKDQGATACIGINKYSITCAVSAKCLSNIGFLASVSLVSCNWFFLITLLVAFDISSMGKDDFSVVFFDPGIIFKENALHDVELLLLLPETEAAELFKLLRLYPAQEYVKHYHAMMMCLDLGGKSLLHASDTSKLELEKSDITCIDEQCHDMANIFRSSLFGIVANGHDPGALEFGQVKMSSEFQKLMLETDLFGSSNPLRVFCFDPGGDNEFLLVEFGDLHLPKLEHVCELLQLPLGRTGAELAGTSPRHYNCQNKIIMMVTIIFGTSVTEQADPGGEWFVMHEHHEGCCLLSGGTERLNLCAIYGFCVQHLLLHLMGEGQYIFALHWKICLCMSANICYTEFLLYNPTFGFFNGVLAFVTLEGLHSNYLAAELVHFTAACYALFRPKIEELHADHEGGLYFSSAKSHPLVFAVVGDFNTQGALGYVSLNQIMHIATLIFDPGGECAKLTSQAQFVRSLMILSFMGLFLVCCHSTNSALSTSREHSSLILEDKDLFQRGVLLQGISMPLTFLQYKPGWVQFLCTPVYHFRFTKTSFISSIVFLWQIIE